MPRLSPERLLNTYLRDALRSIEMAKKSLDGGRLLSDAEVQSLGVLTIQVAELRDKLIINSVNSGRKVCDVAAVFGITSGRVSQIIKGHRA